MSTIKSYAVGLGDMFYIKHNSDNFTIIDCQLFGDHKDWLIDELKSESKGKGISRFISTHPDEDHIQGLEYLDERMPIANFYVVNNEATKPDPSTSFKHYCQLRDGDKAFYVSKGCTRKWMNQSDEQRQTSGIEILWPDTANYDFQVALADARLGIAFNNISLVARYSVQDGASYLWIGDLETQFMDDIFDHINLTKTNVVFAPHHGRKSGKMPNKWLDKLQPEIIVLGEVPSRHMHYYRGYNTLIQTQALDITFENDSGKVHCYSSSANYGQRSWLANEWKPPILSQRDPHYYIGTLNL